MGTVRAFVAIPLPAPLLERLDDLQRRLEKLVPRRSVRWVRAAGIHLTLKFLGDTPTARLPAIEQALAAVARNAPACAFTVAGLGCFPNSRRPRVVWVGVEEPTGRLAGLRDAVEEVVTPLGYEREGRAFRPHLTLGRVQRNASRRDIAEVGEVVARTSVETLGRASSARFALVRSILKPTGAEYTILKEYQLREIGS
jgi:2'-5' RNA ligase